MLPWPYLKPSCKTLSNFTPEAVGLDFTFQKAKIEHNIKFRIEILNRVADP